MENLDLVLYEGRKGALMEQAGVIPFWKKALAFAGWSVLNLIVGMILYVGLLLAGASFLDGNIPERRSAAVAVMVVAFFLAIPITLRWRKATSDEEKARRRARALERQKQDEVRTQELLAQPPGQIEAFIIATIKGVFWLTITCGVLYLAFVLISALPIAAAIVLGSLIIGGSILIAASR